MDEPEKLKLADFRQFQLSFFSHTYRNESKIWERFKMYQTKGYTVRAKVLLVLRISLGHYTKSPHVGSQETPMYLQKKG